MSNRSPRNPEIHQCKLCHRYHSLRFCRSFLAMGPTHRNRVARQYRYCVNCLARTHLVSDCDSPDTCMYCEQLHHTLLHQPRRTRSSVHERLGERPSVPSRRSYQRLHIASRTRNNTTTPVRSARNDTNRSQTIRSRTTRSRNNTSNQRSNRTSTTNVRRRKQRNEGRHQSGNHTSSTAPNQRILSEAIRSLADVLCASSSSHS